MSFGLKNAGATYQRAMVTLFHDMIYKEIEVYVDNMIAKSKDEENHIPTLKKLFGRLKEYQLKLNPAKCTFGVKSRKLLGFVGSAIVDHLADNAIKDYEPLKFDFLDEDVLVTEKEKKSGWWAMYFDSAVNVSGNGAGAVIISPEGKQYPISVKVHFSCTNNTAEYEACIHGLEAALEMKVGKLEVYGDSMLIICQPVSIEIRNSPSHCCSIEEETDKDPWYTDIKTFIQHQEYPSGASKIDKRTLRRMAMEYYIDGEILYKRSFDGTLLRCLSDLEANKALQEVHGGIYATHVNGHMMARQMQIADVIRPINLKASNGHHFILVAIDYFTKWVEACSYAHMTQKVVKRFIEKDLICRYGVPERVVTDNAQNFNGKMIAELCIKWKIKHSNSSPYRPKMNDVVKAANKNIKKIVQKMVITYKD
ncbi:uncharacterized protein [Populus alba]|uniref:uncharacterized protein n=1 Tax=Populus alba TaxID=43335 RepID=UPI003CC787C2